MNPELYFSTFRNQIIGNQQAYHTPYGLQQMIYADWIASGRLYFPIEKKIMDEIGPFVGNTHTETSENGKLMTRAYNLAHENIKRHVNAGPQDVILTTGFGMTSAVVKFQRILGLKSCTLISDTGCLREKTRPVIFI